MIKKYSLVLVAFLCFVVSGFGQVAQFNFPATNSLQFSIKDANVAVSNLTLSAGTIETNVTFGTYFPNEPYIEETGGWNAPSQAAAKNFNFTISANPGYQFTITNISFRAYATGAGPSAFGFAIGSTDIYSVNAPDAGLVAVNQAVTGQSNLTTATIKIQGWLNGSRSSIGNGVFRLDDVVITGTVTAISTADPNLTNTGTPTDHGSVCPSTSATTRTYTITNSGTLTANGITVNSSDPQFVVSGLSSTSIAAGGTATYNVTFTPATAGAKSSTITVASTTGGSNSTTSSLTGTGTTAVTQAVTSAVASAVTVTTATLNGNVTTLGICPSTIEKGFVYSETSLNPDPFSGGANVTKTPVAGIATGAFNLGITGLTNGTGYSFKPYVYNGTTYNYGAIRNFTTPIEADFCNLQFPANETITVGGAFNVWGRVYEPGITTVSGANAAVSAWIGYSTTNNNPNNSGWTWVPATFNAEFGNDDEYVANIGAAITSPNIYYYASRFQISGGPFSYGGISPPSGGGFWNGGTFISGVLTVNPDQVNFCNVDFPKMETIELGNTFNVYAQGYEPGVTDAPGAGTGLEAWIGYNSNDMDPYNGAGWTWVIGTYDSDSGNNDQYVANLGAVIPSSGTYYYASRWRLNGSSFSYGGIASNNVGNFWDAINNNGILTITDPPLADVVITEIMYDTPSTDDEWIEICNVSGTSQNLSSYIIRVNGTNRFTFPVGTFIADGVCVTVSLGSNGDGIYNNSCPFTPDFGIGASSGPTNILPNNTGPYSIQLIASNGISIADEVSYGSGNGANGNGSSLHLSDATLDNSSAGNGNWTTVPTGGSPGVNSLVSPCSPLEPEINVEGDIGFFPDIANNDTTPSGTDNTLFAAQFIGSSQEKGFRIQNLGIVDLIISSISIIGTHPGDFTISIPPATIIPSGGMTTFEVSFSPLAAGVRTADVQIINNDVNEGTFTFRIRGTGECIANPITIFPTSGPENTVVTVNGNNLTGATAYFNGLAAIVTPISNTFMEVTVPANAVTGNLEIIDGLGCPGATAFTVIDTRISECEGGGTLGELFISQVTDSPTGSLTYVELYNATPGAINFATTNYSLSLYNNGNTGSPTGTILINSGTVAQNGTFVIVMGVTTTTCPTSGGDGSLGQFTSSNSSLSINFNQTGDSTTGHDYIGLYNSSSTLVDAFGVFGSGNWANGLGLGTAGANFERRIDVTVPNTAFTTSDWNISNWNTCSDVNYNGIGTFDFSLANPPSVSVLSEPMVGCNLTTQLTVSGVEGVGGGNPLAYQWYYNAPGTATWVEILSSNPDYTGQQDAALNIPNTLNFDQYQYYCQVRENTATCYAASNAVRIVLNAKRWNGSVSNNWNTAANWTPSGVPTIANMVIIPNITTYPILAGTPPLPPTGSPPVYAKSLVILNSANLEVQTGQNLIVENCIINNGTIDLKNTANLVQIDEDNQNSGNGNFFMERTVNNIGTNNYIYWSSPIAGFDISGIPGSNTHRYYWSPTAINSNGTQGNWLTAGGSMAKGSGYIVRISGTGNLNATLGGNGLGTPFNGMFTVPISKGSHVYTDLADNVNNYWNLVGNPYPSAISANEFISVNAGELMDDDTDPSILGTIYLWKHQATPNPTLDSPFYENFAINYDGNNYVAFNATGSNPNGEFSGNIASGQSFFIVMDASTTNNTVTFTNTMRYGDDFTDAYNNGEFLRLASPSQNTESTNNIERHRIWLDLIAPNNSSVSTLVGYVTGATNDKDRLFDGYETNSTGLGFYSIVGHDKMGIQGRSVPFDINDTVPLGLNLLQTGTYNIAINQLDGLFQNDQAIFLENTFTNTIHNLRAAPYSFQSEAGTFNNRFILRYTNSTLSIPEENVGTGLTIIELPNGQVKFMVGNNLTIQSVEIIDMLGRTLYNLKGNNASEIYNLSNLSQAAYIAKVTLSNGQVITKRAVKRF